MADASLSFFLLSFTDHFSFFALSFQLATYGERSEIFTNIHLNSFSVVNARGGLLIKACPMFRIVFVVSLNFQVVLHVP